MSTYHTFMPRSYLIVIGERREAKAAFVVKVGPLFGSNKLKPKERIYNNVYPHLKIRTKN